MGAPHQELRNAEASTHNDPPEVSIIIVSYNTREMTLECIRSIVAETPDLSFEVLFIDNGSEDGSFDAVRGEFESDPRFTIVESQENHGFAGANNLLAAQARGKYLLLLNPDTVVLERALERLTEFAKSRPGNGIWGGRTIYADGSLNPTSCWGRYTLWALFCRVSGLTFLRPSSRIFNPRIYPGWKRTGIKEVFMVTGCLFLIETSHWTALGGFDREFFMYGEEADLCWRAHTAGLRPIVNGEVCIVHHGSSSESSKIGKMIKIFDADVRLFRRHWGPIRFLIALGMIKSGVVIRSVAERLIKGKKDGVWSELWRNRKVWLAGSRMKRRGLDNHALSR